jgi:hypothetical protein
VPGPPPKDPKLRQRTNRVTTHARLQIAPRKRIRCRRRRNLPIRGEADVPWHPDTIGFWREVWASPMAAEFIAADVPGLVLVARLIDRFNYGDVSLAAEIRLQRQCFGLTPLDRRRLQWEIARGEEAEKRRRTHTARDRADWGEGSAPNAASGEMSVLSVPELDAKPWPTLGALVCQFIEENLVFGPGRSARAAGEARRREARADLPDVRGVSEGARAGRAPAVQARRGVAPEGQREDRAGRVDRDLRAASGRAGAVRRLRSEGHPIGRGVTDPYIPMVAYTEEQVEELAYGALRVILEESVLRHDFDIGLERVLRKGGSGRCEPLASSPNSADGARTTFQVFDETHRMARPRLKAAHRTMLANIPKRKLADAWSLETTTAPAPGEGSIAEDTMRFAKQIGEGKISDPKLFFFHRQASDHHDLMTQRGSARPCGKPPGRSRAGPTSTASSSSGKIRRRIARTSSACGSIAGAEQ